MDQWNVKYAVDGGYNVTKINSITKKFKICLVTTEENGTM